MADDRFETLIQGLADGELNEAESQELLDAIRASDELRQRCVEHLAVDHALHALSSGPSDALTDRVMNSLQAPDERVELKERVLKEIHLLDWRKKQKRVRSDYLVHLAALLVLGLVFAGILIRYEVILKKNPLDFPIEIAMDKGEGGMDITMLQTNLVEMDTLPELQDLTLDGAPVDMVGNPDLKLEPIGTRDSVALKPPQLQPDILLPGVHPGMPGQLAIGEANTGLVTPLESPLSTLGPSVDSASYVIARRYLQEGELPPTPSVQTEGFINYFDYDYPIEHGNQALGVYLELAEAPWAPGRKLLLAAVKARELPTRNERPAHLVFLVDISGSMAAARKLPVFKESMRMLIRDLTPRDRVSIVTTADDVVTVCEAVPGEEKEQLNRIIDQLDADGNGQAEKGFDLAYQAAEKYFLKGGINRVVLVTDDDYVKQAVDEKYLHALVDAQRLKNIRMSALRFGPGDRATQPLQALAARGDGSSIRVKSLNQGYHVLAQHLGQTIQDLVEDVEMQLAFNPARVQAYRLIGYNHRERKNPKSASNSMRHGQELTALYEIIPGTMGEFAEPGERPIKRSGKRKAADWVSMEVRYRHPGSSEQHRLREHLDTESVPVMNQASDDMQWAAAVAAFGEKLRGEEVFRYFGYDDILHLTEYVMGGKPRPEQTVFQELVKRAATAQ